MTTAERAKDRRLQAIYKTTLVEQDEKLAQQKWKCPLCGRPFTGFNKFTAYQDHDHKCCPRRKKTFCGKCNRGLLCFVCNKWAIGLMEKFSANKEFPTDFEKAIQYIKNWNEVITAKGGYAKEEKTTKRVPKKQKSVR